MGFLRQSRVVPVRNVGFDPATGVVWDDAKYPFFGRQLDTSAGHLDYDIAELGVNFNDTSRYNDLDQIGIIAQKTHKWKAGTVLKPHIHWMQSNAAIPNMLLKWRVTNNGEAVGSWNLAATASQAFIYTAGTILQISTWPEINTTGVDLSSIFDFKIYRDSSDTSGEFGGADPLTGNWLAKEFDFHFQINSLGSREEYAK
jgi:hypothetical protein